jgi:hypothetical protein
MKTTRSRTPVVLPPLSLEMLQKVKAVERFAAETIKINLERSHNPEIALRDLKTCVVQSCNWQLLYYATCEGFQWDWVDQIKESTIVVIVGLLPSSSVRMEKELRAMLMQWSDHAAKQLEAKPATRAVAETPKASRSARTFREPDAELLKNPDATLNRKNAAQALGISERTLDRWVKDTILTPTGHGYRKRFKVKDLRRMLNSKDPRQSRQE